LKVTRALRDLWQQFGLLAINAMARSADYQIEEHEYGRHERQKLDWYLLSPAAPTVIFFYSGSWRSGEKRDFRFVADTLCMMGYNVVVPDYRLFPEHRFADILVDASTAVDYALAQLVTSKTIIMMGHSAGAQLAALVTLNSALTQQPERISAFVGLSGPYDFYPFTEDDHWDLFGPEEDYPKSQAVNYVRGDAPELYLLHGADDKRVGRGHSKSLMEKQLKAGGRVTREVYPAMGHVDAVLSFSRIHRRQSKLIRDIQSFIENQSDSSLGGK
jgi:acetyl esterase/lipase